MTDSTIVTDRWKKIYHLAVVFFLYATLIVDVYRKTVGINVTQVRNAIYLLNFLFIIIDMVRSKHVKNMIAIFFLFSVLYIISFVINQHESLYIQSWSFFVLRLWPAFYIGKYTIDWRLVSRYTRRLIWIALYYVFVIFYGSPEQDTFTYATLAMNLFFVVWISFYDSFTERKVLFIILGLICSLPVLFLGTRACMFGFLLVIVLLLIQRSRESARSQLFLMLLIPLIILVVIFYSQSIVDSLVALFPNSRSIKFLNNNDVLNDSNRFGLYSRLIDELTNSPFRIHGLLGDQIFLAGPSATDEIILSSFSHNVSLELCMQFGLLLGMLIIVYFLVKLISAFIKSKKCSPSLSFVFIGVLGMSFVNMMVSSSYMNAYHVWLLIGLASCVNHKNNSYSQH